MAKSAAPTPYRQIRALHDEARITVYQAYSESIATAAVREQKLDASSDFSLGRMTWIKPSWNWMMYRSGFSFKDKRQSRILAIKMKPENFIKLLRKARVNEHHEPGTGGKEKAGLQGGEAKNDNAKNESTVVVQWDPERSNRIGKLEHRSIQIGISRHDCEEWVKERIAEIEDVTELARKHKEIVDAGMTNEEIEALGLLPVERPFNLPEDVARILRM
ncbi:hypothetical protein NA57DRAFT_50537 [Rhizodiscina lignyota]|uniref:ATP-dependent RNA helicase DHX8 n=1 Tax=Rhizodiscina lignyota TaxID=1504668 RepID=A0A9P4IQT6_9PEZI|nr:hypothetical protein NA57DRAFT_50537 [Rhizodiscina lignyota]